VARFRVGVFVFLLSGGVSAAEASPTIYAVSVGPEARVLSVDVHFPPGTQGELALTRGFLTYLDGLERERDGGWIETRPRLDSPCSAEGCHLRYRIRLGDAAGTQRRHGEAFGVNGVFEAQPGAWLLRPEKAPDGARYHLSVATPPDIRFVTGIFPGEGGGYDGLIDDLDDAPYSAFGPLDLATISLPGGRVDVAISPGKASVSREDILRWVEASGGAVSAYFGRFPIPRALVLVFIGGRRAVGFGTTMGNGGGSIMLFVGAEATTESLKGDWVLTHEMTHLALPDLMPHHWFEEGVATYVEPIARAQVGIITPAVLWRGLEAGLPNGLPGPGDQGLDRTHTWGRTYWGGALFCFLADLEIREQTHDRYSLQDALRGTLEAGGNLSVHWEIDRFLAAADRATGVRVLQDLYKRMAFQPVPVDLGALWKKLGLGTGPDGIAFDEKAPLAQTRRAFTAPEAGDPKGHP
jgi:hypothetical protein